MGNVQHSPLTLQGHLFSDYTGRQNELPWDTLEFSVFLDFSKYDKSTKHGQTFYSFFFSVLPSKFHSEMKIIPTTHIHSWNLLDTSISSEFRTGHTKRGNEAFVPSFFVSLFLSSSFTPHAPPL